MARAVQAASEAQKAWKKVGARDRGKLVVKCGQILAEHADETGAILPTEKGDLVSNPDVLSDKLGVTKNVIFASYRTLHSLGYIEWQKAARGFERKSGVTGRVRILTSSAQ